jgi:drug/metabolite transporter (DMT)-like permease
VAHRWCADSPRFEADVTGFALALVLIAAVAHATWNLLAKKAGGGAVFVWLYAATSTVLWAPPALPVLVKAWHRLDLIDWGFLIGSGFIHMGYFLLLQRAYRAGDLSLVYPLARGTGPALATIAGIALLGEHPTRFAVIGAALVIVSVFAFATSATVRAGTSESYCFGLLTGVLIAVYTVWDKHAVSSRALPPLLMEWVTSITRLVCLLPIVLRNWRSVAEDWRVRGWYAIWIGALSPLAYLLILFAMTFTPISYIAPTREISILIGALFGTHLLKESHRTRRLSAVSVMLVGVLFLAIG